MKTASYVAAIAFALLALPAIAQEAGRSRIAAFTGPRIEAYVGYDRLAAKAGFGHAGDVTYGLGAGYDLALGSGIIAGVEASAGHSETSEVYRGLRLTAKRDLDASVRLATRLGASGLVYLKAGYASTRVRLSDSQVSSSANLDGIRAGVGYELALGRRAFVKAEYRYTNYENGVSRNQGIAGIGLRF